MSLTTKYDIVRQCLSTQRIYIYIYYVLHVLMDNDKNLWQELLHLPSTIKLWNELPQENKNSL